MNRVPAIAGQGHPTGNPLLTGLAWNAAVAFVYLLTAKLGFLLALEQTNATAVWPPTGIALAVLLLGGTRLWPGVFLGAFLVNIGTPPPPEATIAMAIGKTLGVAAGNTLEAVTGAWLVRQFADGPKAFEQTQSIFKFVYLAAILSTAISATSGTQTTRPVMR